MLAQNIDRGRTEIDNVVYAYLMERFPKLADCDAETSLLESGAIDSLGILELMTFLSDRFGIDLDDGDFDPDNLATPGRLVRFITERKQN